MALGQMAKFLGQRKINFFLADRARLGRGVKTVFEQLDALLANRCNQHGIVVLATARTGFMQPLPSLFLKDFSQEPGI